MIRRFLHSKIHRATVTDTNLDYEGSLTLDPQLMKRAGMMASEQVDVYNITRGTRFTTYIIVGGEGSGEVCVNGAAAHLAEKGDKVIIVTYCELKNEELERFSPTIVRVDDANRPL